MGEPMDRSNRVFARSGTFESVFPDLEDAVVEYYETDLGRPSPSTYNRRHSLKLLGGLIRCGNSLCHRGGYEVDWDVHDMRREGAAQKEFVKRCPGDEGSPKGRRHGRDCLRSLHYRITLKYKKQQA